MAGIAVSNRVVARNDMGRFIRACEEAAEDTTKKLIERGAALSRAMAPVGPKDDPRTPKLKDSITTEMLSSTSGVWKSTARHALAIEKGARGHTIPANVSFFWEREGRQWMWPETYLRTTGFPGADPINHPGNEPQPFLRPAYEQVMSMATTVAREQYRQRI